MGTVFLIILGIAAAAGLWVLIFSRESNPKERAKEAAEAAAGGAFMVILFIFQAVLSVLPFVVGLLIVGFIVRSCS